MGDGGVYASVRDLLSWEREWHRQWNAEASLLHAMLAPSPLKDGSIPAYRFGLEIAHHEGQEVVFHGGGLWGFSTLILRLPQRGVSIVHLANCAAAGPDMEHILAAALA